MGQYYPGTNGSGDGLGRGGRWVDGSGAEVFAARLDTAPSFWGPDIGLRCALTGPRP